MEEPDFNRNDDRKIDDNSALRPDLVYEVIRREGEDELDRSHRSLMLSSAAAGLAISASVIGEAMIKKQLPDQLWAELVADIGYTFGFIIVILGRLQLFTEHTITAVLPIAYSPTPRNILRLLRIWGLVLAGNVVGCTVAAWYLVHSGAFDPDAVTAILELGRHIVGDPFHIVVAKGVGAGFLIAALVWMLPSAGSGGRVGVIFIVTWLIAIAEFAHVIAGTVEIATLVLAGERALGDVVLGFWLPALIGNMIGGTALFAVLAYRQVRDDL